MYPFTLVSCVSHTMGLLESVATKLLEPIQAVQFNTKVAPGGGGRQDSAYVAQAGLTYLAGLEHPLMYYPCPKIPCHHGNTVNFPLKDLEEFLSAGRHTLPLE